MQIQDMVDWQDELNRLEKLWSDMLHISEQQLALLQTFKPDDESDLHHLQELLSQREILMKQIDALAGIHDQADKLQQAAQSSNDRDKAGAMYQAFRSSQDRIVPLMLAIKENDTGMKSGMSEALRITGNELVQARQSARVNRAYTQSGVTSEAWFFDDRK
ncbi:MAG: hypothetical protein ACOX6L_05725 [Syntrophomonadaceae bacterium]